MVSHKPVDGSTKRSDKNNKDQDAGDPKSKTTPRTKNTKKTRATAEGADKSAPAKSATQPEQPSPPPPPRRTAKAEPPAANEIAKPKIANKTVKSAPAPQPEPAAAKAVTPKETKKAAAKAAEPAAPDPKAAKPAAPAPKKAAAKKAAPAPSAPLKKAAPKAAAPEPPPAATPAPKAAAKPGTPKKTAPAAEAPAAEAPAKSKTLRRITRTVKSVAEANSMPPAAPEPKRIPPHREAVNPAAGNAAAEANPPQAATVTPPPPQEPPAPVHTPSRVVLMIRDPEWLYAYWELSPADLDLHAIGIPQGAPPLLLRIMDLGVGPIPAKSGDFFDVTVIPDATGWYVHIPHDGGHWCTALGYLNYEAEFVTIVKSNVVTTPNPIQAEWNEQAWGPVSEEHESAGVLAGVGAGTGEPSGAEAGPSRIVRRAARLMAHLHGGADAHFTRPGASEQFMRPGASEQFMRPGASEQFMRPGASEQFMRLGASEQFMRPGASEQFMRPGASEQFAGVSGLVTRQEITEKGKTFWLQVYTELIVYGATEPDAAVTVQGHPIQLRPDGTFTLRFALPDGEQVIPVHAVNADGDMERTITPIVTKRTV